MTSTNGTAAEQIMKEVTRWPGVVAGVGSRGEISFRYWGVELGHLHGAGVAHFSFTAELGEALRKAGRVRPHPAAPQSVKLGARLIASDDDVADVIEIMSLNYQRVAERRSRREARGQLHDTWLAGRHTGLTLL